MGQFKCRYKIMHEKPKKDLCLVEKLVSDANFDKNLLLLRH